VDREEIAGAVTIVHRKGEEAYSDAIGWQDKEARIPAQRDTLFRIMSMTKPITAVAAVLLVKEGKIRLFDPIHAWLPELASLVVLRDPKGRLDDVVPLNRPITLHDLLTSRFGTGWDDHQLQSEVMKLLPAPVAMPLGAQHAEVHLEPDSWMKRLADLPLLYQPGTRFLYHIAHEVLGVLIARVSGQTLAMGSWTRYAFFHADPLRR
jgi:CubicO group peptidase (beta-lactamase class C family)